MYLEVRLKQATFHLRDLRLKSKKQKMTGYY